MKRQAVSITLDKERSLHYDLNSLALLKERGIDLLSGEADQLRDPGNIRTMVWAGLVHEDATLKEVDVGAMIGLGDLAMVAEKFGEALEIAMGGSSESGNMEASP